MASKAQDSSPEGVDCFRGCGHEATEWFDGPGAGPRRRGICRECEHADWRATARAYTTGQAR